MTSNDTRVVGVLLVVFALSGLWTSGEELPMPPEAPDLVLVLSGGGARGAAHIGVLKVLEEASASRRTSSSARAGFDRWWALRRGMVAGRDRAPPAHDRLEPGVHRQDPARREVLPAQAGRAALPHSVKLRFDGGKVYIPSGLLGGQSLELLLRDLEARSRPRAISITSPCRSVRWRLTSDGDAGGHRFRQSSRPP